MKVEERLLEFGSYKKYSFEECPEFIYETVKECIEYFARKTLGFYIGSTVDMENYVEFVSAPIYETKIPEKLKYRKLREIWAQEDLIDGGGLVKIYIL